MIGKFIPFLPIVLAIHSLENDNPTVQTALGAVEGRYTKSYGGRPVSAFEGIPYASPPVETLRFKEPQPVQPWNGTLVANTTYVCIQFIPMAMTAGIMGSEDCLYLYIYVPKINITGEENLDVVVGIHGGAFMLGAPKYLAGPDYITDRDVVYVTFNYRLGIFGFLSTEDDVIPGNNGLKDQVMALRWIQDHIKNFGGNPASVTITGLSAGGASVHYHYLSPMSTGLFHRGFSQSGTALNPWALTERPLEKTQKLAMHLNCSREWSQEILDCLQEKSSDEIIHALKFFFVFINAIPWTPFGPVIEKGNNSFLPDHPYKLLQQGQINDYPWICSNTKNEGLYPVGFFVLYRKLQELDQNWNEIIPMALDFEDTTTEINKKIVTKEVRERYMNNETISIENISKLIDVSIGLVNIIVYFVRWFVLTRTYDDASLHAGNRFDAVLTIGLFDAWTLFERLTYFFLNRFIFKCNNLVTVNYVLSVIGKNPPEKSPRKKSAKERQSNAVVRLVNKRVYKILKETKVVHDLTY